MQWALAWHALIHCAVPLPLLGRTANITSSTDARAANVHGECLAQSDWWIMNNHDGSLEKTINTWRTSAQAWLWRTFFRLPATWFERHLLKNTYLRLHERSLRQYLCSIQSPVALLCWRAIKGTSAQLHSALWHARGCASQPKSAHT